MFRIYGLLVCSALVLSGGCRKQVEDGHVEYVGTWLGNGVGDDDPLKLEVGANSKASYFREKTGKIFFGNARADNNVFSVGVHKFRIDLAPVAVDTGIDESARAFYRSHEPASGPLMKMQLKMMYTPAAGIITYYRMK